MTGLGIAAVTTCPEIACCTRMVLKYECPWKGRQGIFLKGFLQKFRPWTEAQVCGTDQGSTAWLSEGGRERGRSEHIRARLYRSERKQERALGLTVHL